jgi:hypothetical protein
MNFHCITSRYQREEAGSLDKFLERSSTLKNITKNVTKKNLYSLRQACVVFMKNQVCSTTEGRQFSTLRIN